MGTHKQQEIRVTALGLIVVALLAAAITISVAVALNGKLRLPTPGQPSGQSSLSSAAAER